MSFLICIYIYIPYIIYNRIPYSKNHWCNKIWAFTKNMMTAFPSATLAISRWDAVPLGALWCSSMVSSKASRVWLVGGWWFDWLVVFLNKPNWKICVLVKLGILTPRGENKKCLKPPPSWWTYRGFKLAMSATKTLKRGHWGSRKGEVTRPETNSSPSKLGYPQRKCYLPAIDFQGGPASFQGG